MEVPLKTSKTTTRMKPVISLRFFLSISLHRKTPHHLSSSLFQRLQRVDANSTATSTAGSAFIPPPRCYQSTLQVVTIVWLQRCRCSLLHPVTRFKPTQSPPTLPHSGADMLPLTAAPWPARLAATQSTVATAELQKLSWQQATGKASAWKSSATIRAPDVLR